MNRLIIRPRTVRDYEILTSQQGRYIRVEFRDQGLTRSVPLTPDEALKIGQHLVSLAERARQFGKERVEDGV